MIEIIITFIAGVVSFLSPCVLPLVPAYIGYMGGRVTNTVAAQVEVKAGTSGAAVATTTSARFSTFLHAIAFVGGFTFIFVMLGVLSSALFQIGGQTTVTGIIGRIGGVMIIFFGFHFMGVIPALFKRLRTNQAIIDNIAVSIIVAALFVVFWVWGWTGTLNPLNPDLFIPPPTWTIVAAILFSFGTLGLMAAAGAFTQPAEFWNKTLNTIDRALYADTRRQMTASGQQGYGGSALMGLVFAAGWTPCIGPQLGAAMTLAGASGADALPGALLLATFSLGLGIPFLLTALMLDSAQGVLRKLQRNMRYIELFSGIFLVIVGVTIASGQLQSLSTRFSGEFGDVSYRMEGCIVGIFEGELGFGELGSCISDQETFDSIFAVEFEEANMPAPGESTAGVGTIDGLAGNTGELRVGLLEGNLAPNFTALMLDDTETRLSEYRGQYVLLNFWFTTCAPCRFEMPAFQQAYEAYGDGQLAMLAVNREEGPEAVTEFGEEFGVTFPLLLDELGDLQLLYDIVSYPTTFIIDPEGVIVERHIGPLTAEQIAEMIAGLMSA